HGVPGTSPPNVSPIATAHVSPSLQRPLNLKIAVISSFQLVLMALREAHAL
ncbi:MAG: hypothetical protein ACJAUP_000542, partial [Cellvibrionaceae bacterium]